MPRTPINAHFNLVQMNVPRTELAYEQIRALAAELGDAPLLALVDAGLQASARVSELNRQRRVQSEARSEDREDEFDTQMDDAARRLVKAIRDTHDFMQRSRHSLRGRVALLVETHCPVGPGDIISQRYEEELYRIRALVADLRGPYADLLGELEIERKLQAVEALVPAYAKALTARRKVTAAEVREAAREMHERTLVIVAYIIGTRYGDPAVMDDLLLPVLDQQARIRAILKARQAGQSVGDDPSRDDDDILDVEGADGELGGDEPADGMADGVAQGVEAAGEVEAEAAEADRSPPRLTPLPSGGGSDRAPVAPGADADD